jgi:hypothetical protein
VEPVVYPTVITDPEQQDIVTDWLGSTHADTYVIEAGANNECARCHSPLNWVATDAADLPTTCTSCLLFPSQLSEPDEAVSEGNWYSIECLNCHVIADGSAAALISWVDMTITMPGDDPVYAEVSTNAELCEKCHMDRGTFLYASDLDPDHADAQCTDCHDPHSLETSCGDADCHTEPITGTVHE